MRRQTQKIIDKFIAAIKLLSIELLIVLFAFIASMLTVIFFIKLVFLDNKNEFDHRVFDAIRPLVSDSMTSVMSFFTLFGGDYFLIPANIALIVYTFFITRNKWFAIKVLTVSLSSLLIMFTLKSIFQRPRPLIPLLKEVGGLSFPSGHAFMSFSFFGLLSFMIFKQVENKALRYGLIFIFFLMTLVIGFSRVYLRVHYASDVFAGFSLSLIWLVISLLILGKIEKNRASLPSVNADLK